MKITVQVKAQSRKESVEKLAENCFKVKVNAPPIDGRANERVVELLAEFLDCPPSHIRLVTGAKSKTKIFEIP